MAPFYSDNNNKSSSKKNNKIFFSDHQNIKEINKNNENEESKFSLNMKSSSYLKKILNSKRSKVKKESINDSFCVKDTSSFSDNKQELSDIDSESETMSYMNNKTIKPIFNENVSINSLNNEFGKEVIQNDITEKTVTNIHKIYFMLDEDLKISILMNGDEKNQLKEIKEKYNLNQKQFEKIKFLLKINLNQ